MNKSEIKNLINKTNPVIFEIGCADGIDTKEFINTFGNNMIMYCFEPDNRNANVFVNGGHRPLDPNFTQGITNKNIIFENKAIGNVNNIIKFNQSSTIYSSSLKKPLEHLIEYPYIKFDNTIEVECVTLDQYVEDKEIDLIDFIWADVQGAEDFLIEGGKNTFENKVRFFYTEYSKKLLYENSLDKEGILNLLGDNWEIIQDFNTDILLRNKKFK
jgi:FkbM family methyltransferase